MAELGAVTSSLFCFSNDYNHKISFNHKKNTEEFKTLDIRHYKPWRNKNQITRFDKNTRLKSTQPQCSEKLGFLIN